MSGPNPQYQYYAAGQGGPAPPFSGGGAPALQCPPAPPSCRPPRPPNPCTDAPCVSSALRCDVPTFDTDPKSVLCMPKIKCSPTAGMVVTSGCPAPPPGPPGRPTYSTGAPIGAAMGAPDVAAAPAPPPSNPHIGASYDKHHSHHHHHHHDRYEEQRARMANPDVISSVSNSIDPTSPNATVTRRYFATRTFSLKQAQGNRGCCNWRAHPWTIMRRFLHDKANQGLRTGDLSTCLLTHAAVLQAGNDHIVPFGVTVTGINGNTYTESGQDNRFAFIIMPTNGHPISFGKRGLRIYRPRSVLAGNIVRNWAGLKSEYLNRGIRFEGDYCHVDHRHPLIKVLRENEKLMGFSMDDCKTNEGGTKFELSRQFAEPILARIQSEIIDRIPYVNMGEMTIGFRRADVPTGAPDHYISTEGAMAAFADDPELYQLHITMPKTVSVYIELDYVITTPQLG